MDHLRPVRGEFDAVVRALGTWLAAPEEPPALVVGTAGSTGSPKRVLLSRRAVLASAAAVAGRLSWSGPWVLALPVTYVAGLQVAVRSLVAGHRPVAAAPGGLAPAILGASEAPAVSLVPVQLHRALEDRAERDALRRCRVVLVGGGPIPPGLRDRAEQAGVPVVTTYGATETAGGCVYDGRPLDGVRVRVGPDDRIHIAGPTLFDGYQDDPRRTAASLVDGWFLTSDRGRLDEDGCLEVLGRLDDVVVSGGVNVPLPALSRRLLEHPSVSEAAVVGVPDAEWGQRVVAFVVGTISLSEARDWVSSTLPRTWAPQDVHQVASLPLLPSGKVDRVRLEALA